jgi:hypothetical protein
MKKLILSLLIFSLISIGPGTGQRVSARAEAIGLLAQSQAKLLWVPGHYATIQAAVNAASAGDTIMVATGVYNENVAGHVEFLAVAFQDGSRKQLRSIHAGGDFDGGRVKECSGVIVRGEQRLDFAAQIVAAAASFRQKPLALIAAEVERAIIDFLDLLPSVRVHHLSPLCSRCSHAWPNSIRAALCVANSSLQAQPAKETHLQRARFRLITRYSKSGG